jgi:hypothetical protein
VLLTRPLAAVLAERPADPVAAVVQQDDPERPPDTTVVSPPREM